MDRQEAQRFQVRHPHSTFWCGVLLGGCGGQLSLRVCREKVSHFAHYASTNDCTRRHGGVASADHLYASKQANRWLGSQGLTVREPQFTGDFETGGTCQRVALPSTDEHPTIFFEFSTSITEDIDRLFTHMRDKSSSWLVRENLELIRRLIRENGFALRFRMRTEDLERILEIGTVSRSGSTQWEPINDCTFTSNGVNTTRMREIQFKESQRTGSRKKTAKSKTRKPPKETRFIPAQRYQSNPDGTVREIAQPSEIQRQQVGKLVNILRSAYHKGDRRRIGLARTVLKDLSLTSSPEARLRILKALDAYPLKKTIKARKPKTTKKRTPTSKQARPKRT